MANKLLIKFASMGIVKYLYAANTFVKRLVIIINTNNRPKSEINTRYSEMTAGENFESPEMVEKGNKTSNKAKKELIPNNIRKKLFTKENTLCPLSSLLRTTSGEITSVIIYKANPAAKVTSVVQKK